MEPPALPLYPLSPERVNGMRASPTKNPSTPTKSSGFTLPQSPSLPEIHALRSHVRTNSDVQSLVARFDHLHVKDKDEESVERRRKHDAELRRAQIGREEAESDVRRLREELRRLKRDNEEGRDRERRVGKRLEAVMEEFAVSKETHAAQNHAYEKEVRRARKEAFKSSSALVKLQEELKSTRNSLRITQSGFDLSKQKIQQREQETFNAQFQLVGVQEELDKLMAKLRVVEEEKEALKTSLKEEEVARIAAEGMIALPASKGDEDDEDLWTSPRKRSPKKRSPSPLSDDKENVAVPKRIVDSKMMEEELQWERARREQAEDMIDFLRMECHFNCCACRCAERHGYELTFHDDSTVSEEMARIKADIASVLTPPGSVNGTDEMEIDSKETRPATASSESEGDVTIKPETVPEPELADVPMSTEATEDDRSVTLAPESEEVHLLPAESMETVGQEEAPMAPHPTPAMNEIQEQPVESSTTIPGWQSPPQTPTAPAEATPFRQIRTVTTTTTIPMHFTPASKAPSTEHNLEAALAADGMTPTFDREAALAAIEYRRGRAKSLANGHLTPRKQMLEGVGKERRDISAPALGGKSKALGLGGAASVGRAAGRRMV